MIIKNKLPQQLFKTLLFSTVLLLTNCKKEEDANSEITKEKTTEDLSFSLNPKRLALTSTPTGSYNLANSLPTGYVKNGSVDYTKYLQAAINKYSNVTFPNFPILINSYGLKIGSNKTIYFLEGAKIKLQPTSKGLYYMLRLFKSSNVTIVNPVIEGDRTKHLGTSGEYGMGISISSSNNITIKNPEISECWGDAIHIVQSDGEAAPKNIEITGGRFIKNRRNGISVISVDGLRVSDTYVYGVLENEGGTRPMSGIDMEPTKGDQQMKNIFIDNIKTEHMGAEGIQIRLRRLYSASTTKTISINVSKHEDIGSPLAAFLMEIKNDNNDPSIGGTLNISQTKWRRNPKYVNFGLGWNEPKIKVNMEKVRIYDMENDIKPEKETKEVIRRYMRSNVNYSFDY